MSSVLEFESPFLAPVRDAVRRGREAAAVHLAVRRGVTDETQLTDILFKARHPELGGRRLRPDERALVQEWLSIRSELVRPALQPATRAPAPPAAGGAPLDALRALSGRGAAPTEANAVRILKTLGAFWSVPWQVPYTILEHEGGIGKFRDPDGVMQTIASARASVFPRLPRAVKLAALGLPATDTTLDAQLVRTLHAEFPRRLSVQIAAGTQELVTGLRNFNGYVALAFIAYNAGTRSASAIVRHAAGPQGATGSSVNWERGCLAGATLLHRRPADVVVSVGQWQCDQNLARPGKIASGWFRRFAVHDRATGIQLISFQYLRRLRTQIRRDPPPIACGTANHRQRLDGSGPMETRHTRIGALDKLLDPRKLERPYRDAALGELASFADDGSPLKIAGGVLTRVAPAKV